MLLKLKLRINNTGLFIKNLRVLKAAGHAIDYKALWLLSQQGIRVSPEDLAIKHILPKVARGFRKVLDDVGLGLNIGSLGLCYHALIQDQSVVTVEQAQIYRTLGLFGMTTVTQDALALCLIEGFVTNEQYVERLPDYFNYDQVVAEEYCAITNQPCRWEESYLLSKAKEVVAGADRNRVLIDIRNSIWPTMAE